MVTVAVTWASIWTSLPGGDTHPPPRTAWATTVEPLAVRLNDSTRTQSDIIAGLDDRAVTDECRLAVEALLEKTKAKADPAIQARAQAVRDEIERAESAKRDAIAAIFDADPPSAKAPRVRTSSS